MLDDYIYTCTKCAEDLEPFEVDADGNPISYICTSCGSEMDLDTYNTFMGKGN